MIRKLLVLAGAGLVALAQPLGAVQGDATMTPEPAAPPVALVIGNSDYPAAPLRNALHDARAMAAALASAGFQVQVVENADAARIRTALEAFRVRQQQSTLALFYFAGHGAEGGSGPTLLPVDAPLDDSAGGLALTDVAEALAPTAPGRKTLLLVDACRVRPTGHAPVYTTDTERRLPLPDGVVLAMATHAGAEASDGGGSHGLFTGELLRAMQGAGSDWKTLLGQARKQVITRSQGRQRPSIAGQPSDLPAAPGLAVDIPSLAMADTHAALGRGILPQSGEARYELEFWESIKDSKDAADYEAYLEAFPNGKFAPLARVRAKRYKKAEPAEPGFVVQDMDTWMEASRTANLRAQPSADAKRVGELKRGARVLVTGRVKDRDWYRVKTAKGATAYVYAELLRPPAPKAAAKPKPKPKPRPAPVAKKPAAPTPPPAKTPTAGAIAGAAFRDCPACPELIPLQPGTFTMGSRRGDPSERPAHRVTLRKPFAIGKYEVTVAQWKACTADGACKKLSARVLTGDQSPVRDISWDQAQQYLKWLSRTTGKRYRFPSEAEWEYAARAGTTTTYWWGDRMRPGMASCKDCGGEWDKAAPPDVGSFPANPFGLHDTSGSVWEWVADCWHRNYQGAPSDGRVWDKEDCRERVIRGGGWRNDSSYVHSASRFKYDEHIEYILNGLRVARDME